MRGVTRNRFPIKNLPVDSLLISHMESSYFIAFKHLIFALFSFLKLNNIRLGLE